MTSSENPAENTPRESKSPDITREMAVGSGWMVGAQLAIQAIGFLRETPNNGGISVGLATTA
jgi:hypothetical protein